MNYELAKQLKDAGFSQFGKNRNVDGSLVTLDSSIGQIHDFIYIPTLEELVEACERDGYFDFSIKHDKAGSKWYARIIENSSTKSLHIATSEKDGSTPTEAVGRLLLALYANTGASA